MAKKGVGNLKFHHVPIEKGKSIFFDSVHIFWHEQVTFHQHLEWEISYIITGSGTRLVGDLAETFSRGEIVLLPPNMPHCWSFDEFDHDEKGKIQNTTICFPGSLLEKFAHNFPEIEPAVKRISEFHEAIKFEGSTLLALQKMFLQMPSQSDLNRLTTLMNMFSLIASSSEMRVVGHNNKSNKSTSRMREIHRYILNNYQNDLSLDDIAQHMGMNRSSLCVFFKRVQGKSLFTYLNEFRIESSCLMLRETTLSVSEVCHAVGFNDVPYYNRLFKKIKGMAPGVYRTTNRN